MPWISVKKLLNLASHLFERFAHVGLASKAALHDFSRAGRFNLRTDGPQVVSNAPSALERYFRSNSWEYFTGDTALITQEEVCFARDFVFACA
jgi:hypothetical protein